MNEEMKDLATALAFEGGIQAERERILELVKSYYCGEPGCTKHFANMSDLIERIKGDK